MAGRILEATPVVWGAEGIGAAAAMRFKCQLNENGKIPAWWSVMSELDHNEIAAWKDGTGQGYHVIALRSGAEGPGIAPRFALSTAIARDAGATTEEIWAEGETALSRLFSLIAIGDWVSIYVALARGVDPTPVDSIQRLKRELAG
jgi:glucose/mannose-6-phosphate isomerase